MNQAFFNRHLRSSHAAGHSAKAGSALLLLALLALALPVAAESLPDWGHMLAGGDAPAAAADTGIVGMSAEEMASYTVEMRETADSEEPPEDFVRGRRRFVMREMKFNADWDTDPTAVPAFIEQFKRRTGLEALALQPRKPLAFDSAELTDWPFIYLTAHNAFTLSEADVRNLRNYFLKGGFMYADDCLFGFPFGQAFPGEMSRSLPESEFKRLDPKDPVFGLVLKQFYGWAQVNEAGLPTVFKPNSLQIMEIGGHIALVYTPLDIGCLWEISSPPSPANPLGGAMHNMDLIPGLREAGYRLGLNVVIYSMLH